MTASASRLPLLVVGIDAGDPDLLERWANEGHLPQLAAIMRDGSHRRTGGTDLAMEHGAWVTLLSGVPRAVHGYHYFRQLVPGSYRLALTTGPAAPVAPFWASLRDHRVVTFDVPDFRPVDGLRGVQLADVAVHNRELEAAAIPADALPAVLRAIGDVRDIPEAFRSTAEDDERILARLLTRVERKGTVARRLVTEQQPDLAVVVFGEGHTAGHQCWRWHRGAASHPRLADGLRRVYAAIDRELGALRASMPQPHRVVVLSSVGLRTLYPGGDLGEAFLRALGFQCAPPATAGTGMPGPLALARRLLPEPLREALSRRLGRDVRERLYADRFTNGTDWSRSRVFAVPSAFQSFLRVNLRGREPSGVVAPGQEYEALLDELERELAQLRDPATGRAVLARTTRPGGLGAPPHTLPDLVVDWDFTDRFITTIEHRRARLALREPEFFRDSEHTDEGFLAMAGPGVAATGAQPPLDATDVAPLLADLATVPPAPRATRPHAALP